MGGVSDMMEFPEGVRSIVIPAISRGGGRDGVEELAIMGGGEGPVIEMGDGGHHCICG